MAYEVNQTVLAEHGIMLYDAKVLKIDHEVKPVQYFVHYKGWAKKWDAWVPETRIYLDTPEFRALQVQKKQLAAEELKKNKQGKKTKRIITSSGGLLDKGTPFKRLKVLAQNDTEDHGATPESSMGGSGTAGGSGSGGSGGIKLDDTKRVTIPMPFILKKQLVLDWKEVTQEPYRLVSLPRKPTVAQIFKNYLEFKRSKMKLETPSEEQEFKNIESIVDGIQSYFDRSVNCILLYRMERRQYEEIHAKHEEVPLSSIYGAEHLLRLFVRLPVLLGNTLASDQELSQVVKIISDFLKFLQKHHSNWFMDRYDVENDPEYVHGLLQKTTCHESTAGSTSTPTSTPTSTSTSTTTTTLATSSTTNAIAIATANGNKRNSIATTG